MDTYLTKQKDAARAAAQSLLPPNIEKIVRRSQQEAEEVHSRTGPVSTRQGFVVAEEKLRENPYYRLLCAFARRWGDRELLAEAEGSSPQLYTGGEQYFNLRTRMGRARAARIVETVLLHLPSSMTEARRISKECVNWLSVRVATSLVRHEPWFPRFFTGLVASKAKQLGRKGLSPDADFDREDHGLGQSTQGADYHDVYTRLAASARPKTPPVRLSEPVDDALVAAEADSHEQGALSQSARHHPAEGGVPRIYRHASARPGHTYDFQDRTAGFYVGSRNPLGGAQQVLSDYANQAVHGASLAVMGHTPIRPNLRPITSGEKLLRQSVFEITANALDRAPFYTRPLTVPYAGSMFAARQTLSVLRDMELPLAQGSAASSRPAAGGLGVTAYNAVRAASCAGPSRPGPADGPPRSAGASSAGRVLSGVRPSTLHGSQTATQLSALAGEVSLDVRAYSEGRQRARSAKVALREGRRFGPSGYRGVLSGSAAQQEGDYFGPTAVPKHKGVFEQFEQDFHFDAEEVHIPDTLLDQHGDFTGLGIARLNEARVRALAGLAPPAGRACAAAEDGAGADADADAAGASAASLDGLEAGESDSLDREGRDRDRDAGPLRSSAYMYRKAVAAHVFTRISLPLFDNRLQPLAPAPPQEGAGAGAYAAASKRAVADGKGRAMLEGGRYRMDPRVHQVLDASRGMLNNRDLFLDSDSDDQAGRKQRRSAAGAADPCAPLFQDSDPSDAAEDAPAPADRVEGPALAVASQARAYRGAAETLQPFAAGQQAGAAGAGASAGADTGAGAGEEEVLLARPAQLAGVVLRTAAGARRRALLREAADREEAEALRQKAKREKERRAAMAGSTGPAGAAKKAAGAKKRRASKGDPGVLGTMARYTASGAPTAVENMALDAALASCAARDAGRHAQRCAALADGLVAAAAAQEDGFAEREEVNIRTTRVFNALAQAAQSATGSAAGDSGVSRALVVSGYVKNYLGRTVFDSADAAGAPARHPSEEEQRLLDAIVTEERHELKPYAFENGAPLDKLLRSEHLPEHPVAKADGPDTGLFDRTYLPLNAPVRAAGAAELTVPYTDPDPDARGASLFCRDSLRRRLNRKRFAASLDERAGGPQDTLEDVRPSLELCVGANAAEVAAGTDTGVPPQRRQDIQAIFSEAEILNASATTQVYRMRNVHTDSSVKVDPVVAERRNEGRLFGTVARQSATFAPMHAAAHAAEPSAAPGTEHPAGQASADDTIFATKTAAYAKEAIALYKQDPEAYQRSVLNHKRFGREPALQSLDTIGTHVYTQRQDELERSLSESGIRIAGLRPAFLGRPPEVSSLQALASLGPRIGADPMPRRPPEKPKKGKKGKKAKKLSKHR